MPGAALVAVLLLGSSAEAGAVRRCRSDERGRVACQPLEARRFRTWELYERSLQLPERGLRAKQWECTRLANGVIACRRLGERGREAGRVWLYERRPNALPGLVSAPETFR